MRTITIDIFSGNGIAELQKVLESEAKRLRDGMKTLVHDAAERGAELANQNYATAQYDGTLNQDKAEPLPGGSDTEMTVRLSGPTAQFIEFGTGVFYPDDYPKPVGRGKRGTYGRHYGKNPKGWHYKGDPGSQGFLETAETSPKWKNYVLTVGSPANAPLYYGRVQLLDEAQELVNKAFAFERGEST